MRLIRISFWPYPARRKGGEGCREERRRVEGGACGSTIAAVGMVSAEELQQPRHVGHVPKSEQLPVSRAGCRSRIF